MSHSDEKHFFETAYKTGTDTWTHIPLSFKGAELIEKLKPNAMILDLGSGRGRFPFTLAESGFRIIGIDYVDAIVEKNNAEVKERGLDKNMRFLAGDALDLPFSDAGFDAAIDVGLLHHLHTRDWALYVQELVRTLKPGGYFYLIAYSRETPYFFTWMPNKNEESGEYEKYGLPYYFFTEKEIEQLFAKNFSLVNLRTEHVTEGINPAAYVVALMQKK